MASSTPTEPQTWTCENCGSEDGPHFDRSLCICGAMHYYCGECGSQDDDCDPHGTNPYASGFAEGYADGL